MKVDLGSKIENFMRDVLENGEDKEIFPTSDEIHLAQDTHSTIHENPSKKRFGKFLLLGLTVLSLAQPVLAQEAQENSIPGSFQHEVAEVQATSTQAGFVGNNIHVGLHILHQNVGSDYEKMQDLAETSNNSITHDNGVCDVNVTYSQDGRSAFLGYTDEMQKISSPATEAQMQLSREMVLLHEMSHCEFAKIHHPFLVDGNPALQEKINYFFKYNDSTHSDDQGSASSMYSTLNENFADTYGVIQMIKIHGLTPDVMRTIHSVGAQRKERTLTQGENDSVEAHATENAIHEILQPNTLKAIESTQDPEVLKQIALKIANHSVAKLYATYSDISQKTYSLSSFEDGVQSIIMDRIAKPYMTHEQAGSSIESPFDNAENSFAVKISDAVMAKLDLTQIKISPHQVSKDGVKFNNEQSNKIYYLIQDVISEQFRSEALQMRQAGKDYSAYIHQNFSADMTDYLNSKNTPVEVAEKIFAVQDDYISQEGTATQKANLMAQINQNRENVAQNNNTMVASVNASSSSNVSLSSKIQMMRKSSTDTDTATINATSLKY